jgi:hypothetical protein
MLSLLRRSDAAAVAAVLATIAAMVPSEAVTNSPNYQELLAKMPSGIPWFFAGFFASLWLFYPWGERSRAHAVWAKLTRKFDVESFGAGQFLNLGGDEHTPQTDVIVRLRIRFVKSGHYKMRVRLFACTGRGRKPMHHVSPLDDVDAVRGEILDIPVVDMGIPEPGWDHQRPRGWGPKKSQPFIGKSRNVAMLECTGILTQSYRMFIEMVNHDTGVGKFKPSIYVQGEDEDIWDVSENAKHGRALGA